MNKRSFPANIMIMLLVLLVLNSGCSSPPELEYRVTTYQMLSHSLLAQADRQRQLEQYQAALDLYLQAEKYGKKRNDKLTIGLSMLKRASIHLAQNQFKLAIALIEQVITMDRFETVELANPIAFIQAKLAFATGDVTKALKLVEQLRLAYTQTPEKAGYYQLVKWVYLPDSVSITTVEQTLILLDELVKTHKLENIEIYSFAIFNWAKWLSDHDDPRAVAAIRQALDHFSMLELPNKISACYQLGADYYARAGQTEQAAYFLTQAKK